MSSEKPKKGMQLLKKGHRGLVFVLFSRLGLFLILLALQAFLLFSAFYLFVEYMPHILGSTVLFTVIMVLYLINSRLDSSAKITWLVVIMLLPVFGSILFWYTQSEIGHRAVKKRVEELDTQMADYGKQNEAVLQQLQAHNPQAARLATYIHSTGNYPICQNEEVVYFPDGDAMWKCMLEELEKAQDFIFLEYFIIDEGCMWGNILEILARKAQEGVDVRVLYDGTCEFSTLPHTYPGKLARLGIQCKVFSPFVPLVSTHYNYRDHRKIMVIDGKTAFTGGVNLADEYINQKERFGYWKDTALMVKGAGVDSFTLMFLQMWNLLEANPIIEPYLKHRTLKVPEKEPSGKGWIVPYADCPLDAWKTGEAVYMDILARASTYVHIMTPYLILDGEMLNALQYAAMRGVDVKLILPGIPDKKSAYALAKTHYAALLDAGVQIYEFTPGFVHAKVFVSDDREGVVGTINLDYRSLYHHFECAAWMYETPVIQDLEADFQNTLRQCRKVTRETIWQGYRYLHLPGILLKVLAPLM